MDLHREVLPPAERPADPGEGETNLFWRKPQRLRHLVAVDVQPLGGDVEVHAPLPVRHGEAGLGAEERLVLHPDLVLAGDHDDVGGRVRGVAVQDLDAPEHVAGEVKLRGVVPHRVLGARDGVEHLVLDPYLFERAPRRLRVVGGDYGYGLALVAHLLPGEHGLVRYLHPVHLAPRHVLVGQYRPDARHFLGLGGIEHEDVGVRVRAPERRAVEHPVHPEVRGVLELSPHLRDAVDARALLAHATGPLHGCLRARARRGWHRTGRGRHGVSPAARRTASRIFS